MLTIYRHTGIVILYCYYNSNNLIFSLLFAIIIAIGGVVVNVVWYTPADVTKSLAAKIKNIRRRKKITQKQLAARSNVSYASLRKFEQTGQISLESFVKLTMELGLIGEINALFEQPVYSSIEEVLRDGK